MPIKFTVEEKEILRVKLRELAQSLFCDIGFAKTTINKLVDTLGIAKGTFYMFYNSKEALYFDLLLDKEEAMHKEAMSLLDEALLDQIFPLAYCQVVASQVEEMATSNFMKVLFNMDLMERLWSKTTNEQKKRSIDFDIYKHNELIEKSKINNYELIVEKDVFTGAMRALVIALLKDDLIGDRYIEVKDLLIQSFINAVFRERI